MYKDNYIRTSEYSPSIKISKISTRKSVVLSHF